MIKVSDYIFTTIQKIGIRHVFMLPGGGCMHLVDSLGRNKHLSYIPCLHEQGASIAAGAYAQYTNNLGVALVTTGPGGTNAITGVAAAWVDSIPLLILSGQVKRSDMSPPNGPRSKGFQELKIIPVVQSICKYAATVIDPETIRFHLEKAVYEAKNGRPGPVWLDIPLDIQASYINEHTLQSFSIPKQKPIALAVQKQIRKAIGLIQNAQRPVILAGYGVKLASAHQDFNRFIRSLRMPVLTTWKAVDLLPDTDPLFCGRPGAIGQRGANFVQQNSDVLLCIGTRLDLGQIAYSYNNFARGAVKIIIDVDKAELQKLRFENQIRICVSADTFLKEGLKAISDNHRKNVSSWLHQCKAWYKKYPVVLEEYKKQKKYVSSYALIDILSKKLNTKDCIVPGSSGACSEVFMQTFRVKRGQRILNTTGLGAMGFGLPASIGACIANGGHRTVCINGDGGFQMNTQELATVARLKLPIKYFILNNQGYNSIRNMQRTYFQSFFVASDAQSGLVFPSSIKIAKAYGIRSVVITTYSQLKRLIDSILDDKGPIICDVRIDPLEQTKPKLASQLQPDGSMKSLPMEDLWPFLDRKEFVSNMIVK